MIRLAFDRSLYVGLGAAAGGAALVGSVLPSSTRYGFNLVPVSVFAVTAFVVLAVHFAPSPERARGVGGGMLLGALVAACVVFYLQGNLYDAKYAAVGGGAMGGALGTQVSVAVNGREDAGRSDVGAAWHPIDED